MSASFTAVDTIVVEEHQRVFRLDTGELFVVEITSPELAAAEAAHWIALRVRAFQVDEQGAPVSQNGVPVVAPAHTCSIPLAALSTGQITVEAAMAAETSKAAEYFRNHLTALRAWQRIPRTPTATRSGATS